MALSECRLETARLGTVVPFVLSKFCADQYKRNKRKNHARAQTDLWHVMPFGTKLLTYDVRLAHLDSGKLKPSRDSEN